MPSVWLPLLAWVCVGRAKLCTKADFPQHRAQGKVREGPKAP